MQQLKKNRYGIPLRHEGDGFDIKKVLAILLDKFFYYI